MAPGVAERRTHTYIRHATTMNLQAHQHILPRGQVAVQIVRLKDESQPAAQCLLDRGCSAV